MRKLDIGNKKPTINKEIPEYFQTFTYVPAKLDLTQLNESLIKFDNLGNFLLRLDPEFPTMKDINNVTGSELFEIMENNENAREEYLKAFDESDDRKKIVQIAKNILEACTDDKLFENLNENHANREKTIAGVALTPASPSSESYTLKFYLLQEHTHAVDRIFGDNKY